MFHFLPIAIRYDGSKPAESEHGIHGYQVHIGPMYADTRGWVRIRSTDPREHPAVQFNYLSTEADRREWIEMVRAARNILEQPGFAAFSGGEISPGPTVQTDQEILDWVARDAETALHPSCTAKMGTDDAAVVDPATMRVHGTEGLRVVDASVFPFITNGNIYAPGDDGRREGRRPDRRQHAAARARRSLVPPRPRRPGVPARRPAQRRVGRRTRSPERRRRPPRTPDRRQPHEHRHPHRGTPASTSLRAAGGAGRRPGGRSSCPSVLLVTALAVWAIISPTRAETLILSVVTRVTTGFGWFYVAADDRRSWSSCSTSAFSRYGTIRLGPDHSRPQFSTFSWASMLFAAGIGTDVMFYSVVEPVTQYMAPPIGDPETVAAAREATVWTLFHYGITGWALYALMGIALAYFAYRLNLPLAVRSALYPIFGKRVDGALGHAVDTAAVLGTVFGDRHQPGDRRRVPQRRPQHALRRARWAWPPRSRLAVLAVIMAALSAISGVDKGIRFLSQLNVLLAIALAAWVLLTGRTTFLLNAVVMNVGDFVRTFPAQDDGDLRLRRQRRVDGAVDAVLLGLVDRLGLASSACSWPGSRAAARSGSSSLGTMVIPFSYIVMWISIFGNAAIDRVAVGDADVRRGRAGVRRSRLLPPAGGLPAVRTS